MKKRDLLKKVFEKIEERFDCWEEDKVVTDNDYQIWFECEESVLFSAEIKAAIEIVESFNVLYSNSNIYLTIEKEKGLVINVSVK